MVSPAPGKLHLCLIVCFLHLGRSFVDDPCQLSTQALAARVRTVPFTAPAGSATYVYTEGNLTFTQMLQKVRCKPSSTCSSSLEAVASTRPTPCLTLIPR